MGLMHGVNGSCQTEWMAQMEKCAQMLFEYGTARSAGGPTVLALGRRWHVAGTQCERILPD